VKSRGEAKVEVSRRDQEELGKGNTTESRQKGGNVGEARETYGEVKDEQKNEFKLEVS
jgi:hypothetical protein